MRICDKCSSEILDDSKFCPECGDKVDENDVHIEDDKLVGKSINIVCPVCEQQSLYNINLLNYSHNLSCSKCKTNFNSRIVQIRAKKSRKLKGKTSRQFDVRVINPDNTEDLISFINPSGQDFELRSKDVGIFTSQKGKMKVVQNSSISKYIKIDSGCFIATYVYGFDSEEVSLLRQYRDDVLLHNVISKSLVSVYYLISPILIKIFGSKQLFQKMSHKFLNYIVERIKKKAKS